MTPVPAIDAARMSRVDAIMRDDFGVDPIQLMEHAGFAVATCVRMRFADHATLGRKVLVLAGSGGNGGDALVAARFLQMRGASVTVVLTRPAGDLTGLAAHQLRPLEQLGIPIQDGTALDALPAADVVLDGLLGAGTSGPPRGAAATLIRLANASNSPVLAIDVPSGFDGTTGAVYDPCVRADATVTLGLPKTGLTTPGAATVTGSLILVDIGIPAAAYARVGVTVPVDLFAESWYLPLAQSAAARTGADGDH